MKSDLAAQPSQFLQAFCYSPASRARLLFSLAMLALLASGCRSGRHELSGSHNTNAMSKTGMQPTQFGNSQAPVPFQYVNAAQAAGLRFKHDDCRKGMATMMEQAGPGCALLDYDNDGWLDIYLPNGRDLYNRGWKRQNALYHNNRDGTFTDVTNAANVPGTGYGQGVAVGDYDNDGFADIYVCQYGKNVLYHNNGNGTFTDVTARAHVDGMDFGEPFHTGAAWMDVDGDGKLDLFVCGYVQFRTGPRYCRFGTMTEETNCPPSRYKGTYCILYHNNGDGTFTNITKKAGVYMPGSKSLTALVGDFNDDGWPDIYVGNDGKPAYLLLNNHKGGFREVGTPCGAAVPSSGFSMAAMGVDAGDYNNLGRLSLFISDFQEQPNHLFDNMGAVEGKPMFMDVSTQSGIGPPGLEFLGFGGGFMDYDNDGWLDVVVVNGHVYPEIEQQQGGKVHYKQHPQLFRNTHNGTFREVTADSGPALRETWASRGAVWGDIWNRGVLDVLAANNTDTPSLWKHGGTPGRHFFALKLHGTKSNRDAAGARVWVTTGNDRQMQEVKNGVSYLSSGDTRLHFGLGAATGIDKLEVRWPLGRRDTFTHVPADQFAALTEGETTLHPQPLAPSANAPHLAAP